MGKRGPKPKGEYAGKSSVLSTTITPDLRAKLEEAVSQSGLTISREVEHRLRWSFEEDSKIATAFGSKRDYAVMKMCWLAIEIAKADNWLDDASKFQVARSAIDSVLDLFEGKLKKPPGGPVTAAVRDASGRAAVLELLEVMADLDPSKSLSEMSRREQIAVRIRDGLGEQPDPPSSKPRKRSKRQ